jgi:hypothetical protein
MITIFATPKAFSSNKITLMQRNAIRSWVKLMPNCQILLVGNDQGVSEIAQEFHLQHISGVETNEFGTPLISSIFNLAISHSQNEIMAYVNADIILMQDFLSSIHRLPNKDRLLVIGRRWDLNIEEEINCDSFNWENQLRERLKIDGVQDSSFPGSDYFIFKNNMWGEIPPISLGRFIFDNWLISRALQIGAMVIDATPSITAIHHIHDYSHHPLGTDGVIYGQETWRDLQLAGGPAALKDLFDAQYVMNPQNIEPILPDKNRSEIITKVREADKDWLEELNRRHKKE